MRERRVWRTGYAVVLCCGVALGAVPAKSKTAAQRRVVERSPWEKADRGRGVLEAIAEGSRTRADYTKAMDGFRAIYHETPKDKYAPAAVNTVAELLAELGRSLHDAKSLKAAVGQYEFLRTQYPGSSLRVGALLAEAQIYENDLRDAAAARETYAALVKHYPKSEQAEEARAGLASLEKGATRKTQDAATRSDRAASVTGEGTRRRTGGREAAVDSAESVTGASSFAPMPVTQAADQPAQKSQQTVGGTRPKSSVGAKTVPAPVVSATPPVDETAQRQDSTLQSVSPMHVAKTVETRRRGELAQVTGIRHWSTPNYTRVAIDLGDDVTYEAARVPNPDRIYFDLHGTRLAQELVGKSFAVTDDGFLKKIRAAQFSDDMTRVVLDVNDVTEYSAFLLPNPYRLIIDIHGGREQGSGLQAQGTESAAPAGNGGTEAGAEAPAPRVAPTIKSTTAKPVPNTVTSRSASNVDIASLSAQPGKVQATNKPTSQPISAVVQEKDQNIGSREPAEAIAGPSVGAGSAPSPSGKRTKTGKASQTDPAVPARAAVPTADGQTSLVRALGLKIGRIVIDAGHGGHDSGTLGVDGLEEKDVVLDVALRLGKMLHDRLGAEIIYTRSDDTFIPLETRTAIANKAQADLFLSIHANSSSDPSARGVETYYLNFTSQLDALEVAARENAVSDQSIHQLSDLVKKIALKEKIDESREFASDVEENLYGGLQRGNAGLKNRGVKKAPFVVLIGANMPSILAEISFVTNPKDASQLRQPEYRQRVADSLFKGVAKYAGGLSGTKVPTERASTK
ncbi:MAG: cell wall hydrolase/autolysin [Edaphobacter sp.]|nr:cell wall hydrolase/autolysin [Edaphobacter sp.]